MEKKQAPWGRWEFKRGVGEDEGDYIRVRLRDQGPQGVFNSAAHEEKRTALTRIGAVKKTAGGDPAQVQNLQSQACERKT